MNTNETSTARPNQNSASTRNGTVKDNVLSIINTRDAKRLDSISEIIDSVIKENSRDNNDPAGFQSLTAGTPPGQARDTAETSPEHPAGMAGTAGTNPTRKRRANVSPLDELPEETQAIILELLDERSLDAATLEITSKKPYGMGIQTSRSALDRFHQRQNFKRVTQQRQHIADDAAQILEEAKSSGELFPTAAHLIELRLLEATVAENSDPKKILSLSRSLERVRSLTFAERRLRLAEGKSKNSNAPSKVDSSEVARLPLGGAKTPSPDRTIPAQPPATQGRRI